ncbi:MAG: leucine-rich repeat domain-containing protein [Eubacteriales bacterium]|nr:leucine-rich repeat domain-containing protein [Eubacteriales bacterium]
MTNIAYSSAQTKRAANRTVWIRAAAALLLCALALTLAGCDLFKDRSATELVISDAAEIDVDDLVKYESLALLDLRAAAVEPDLYRQLQTAMPKCRILWSVPIGSQRFDNQLTELTLPADTDAEMLELLNYFPNLSRVDARACSCYDALMSKSIEMSTVSFVWQVAIADVTALSTDAALDVSGKTVGGGEALMTALAHLPSLTSVDMTETDVSEADAEALGVRFPDIEFLRTLDVFGVKVNSDATTLDLTGAQSLDDTALIDKLAPLTKLTSVNLAGQTLSFDTMAALKERYPFIQFSFTFELFGQQLTPETTELDLSGQTFTEVQQVSEGLMHLPALAACNLCGSGLTNEQMLELKAAFPNVKFVWYVDIGAWRVRTDIEAFSTANHKTFPSGAGEYTGDGRTSLTNEETAMLQYCTDLVYLDLGGNKISDVSFVQYLPKLRVLILATNKITDITPLSGLAELEYLELFINYVADVKPLSGLSKLAYLNIARTGVTDVTPLESMKQLKMLWIMNNKIEDANLKTLAEALPDCTISTRGSNSTANGWYDTEIYREFREKSGLPE